MTGEREWGSLAVAGGFLAIRQFIFSVPRG